MIYNRITIENNEPFLRQISKEVDLKSDNYREWVDALKEYCQNNAVYALAPVQIGIPKRMIYLKNTTSDMSKNMDSDYDEGVVLINPVVVSAKGHARFLEGCESCLDYVAVIDRPYSVKVEFYDINGSKNISVFEGFKATVFSHEYDHLNGILHIDLSDNIKKMSWDEKKMYRENHPYEIISKNDNYDFETRTIFNKE